MNKKEEQFTYSERMKHMSWCLKNDIKIYFRPINWRLGNLVIEDKGKRYITNETYTQPTKKKKLKNNEKKWWVEIMRLYTSKYLEHNKQLK